MTPTDNSDELKQFKEPEIFLALNKISRYLVNDVWNTSVLGSGEAEAEHNLAVSRSKRYEHEIKILANIDFDLAWGQVKRKTKEGLWVTTGDHNYNPWYEGELGLRDLLSSLEELVDLVSSTEPRYLTETEFLHYYYFLSRKVTINHPKPALINIQNLHADIKKHCTKLFNNGHYSDAILTAYKVVLNKIKELSGINNLDGKKLIEKSFSLENPLIKLNSLSSQSDKDEQLGFMLLYSGAAVGIRNPKAHDLVIQDDKQKTLEYLAFASLLLDRLDSRISP